MGYCMTKSFMKSLLFVLPFCCFADGDDWSHGCYYDTNDNAVVCPSDASPKDVCLGTKYVLSQELQTLSMSVYGASSAVETTLTNLNNQYNSESCYTNFVCYESTWNHIQSLSPAQTEFYYMFDSISLLNNAIQKYDCSSCSGTVVTNDPSGGTTVVITNQCCDFSSILDRFDTLNNAVSNRIYNILLRIYGEFEWDGTMSDNLSYFNLMSDGWSDNFEPVLFTSLYPYNFNLGGISAAIVANISDSLPSINNYLYDFSFNKFPPFADHMTNNIITLTQSSTNFFSLFQGEPVLSDYWKFPSSVRGKVSYYQFLTNHYIAVSQGQLAYDYQGVDVEITKTNWLDRIETLLAAIVFNDGGAVTNTVNANYQQEDPDGLISTMSEAFTDLENDPQSSLGALRDTSQSLVSSIRKFSTAFQDASMPGTVRLVNLGPASSYTRSSSDDGDSIEFATSDGGAFFEMCRCATTIAWTLIGIILVVVFLSWSAKTSYNMFLFCWDVFNGIFAK